MPVLYSMPDSDDVTLLARALADWHKPLADVGARVQILFASADPESETQTAPVKHGGYPARATIRVVPTKDRLTKGYDAEMLVDRDWWGGARESRRVALLDHELSHLELVLTKDGQPAYDDLNRPRLKLRKGDYASSDGFFEVIARHGDEAAEFESLSDCWKLAERAKLGELPAAA